MKKEQYDAPAMQELEAATQVLHADSPGEIIVTQPIDSNIVEDGE